MKTASLKSSTVTLARCVAPEDLRPGDYVAVLHELHEVPAFLYSCDACMVSPEAMLQLRIKTREGGLPLKVKAICLPFILLQTPKGDRRSVDIRQVQLARLDRKYAKYASAQLRRVKGVV